MQFQGKEVGQEKVPTKKKGWLDQSNQFLISISALVTLGTHIAGVVQILRGHAGLAGYMLLVSGGLLAAFSCAYIATARVHSTLDPAAQLWRFGRFRTFGKLGLLVIVIAGGAALAYSLTRPRHLSAPETFTLLLVEIDGPDSSYAMTPMVVDAIRSLQEDAPVKLIGVPGGNLRLVGTDSLERMTLGKGGDALLLGWYRHTSRGATAAFRLSLVERPNTIDAALELTVRSENALLDNFQFQRYATAALRTHIAIAAATTFQDRGNHKAAVRLLTRAIEGRPRETPATDLANLYVRRAFSQAKLQRYSAALADLDVASRLDSTWSVPPLNRAHVFLKLRRPGSAIDELNVAQQRAPAEEVAVALGFAAAYDQLNDSASA